LEPPGKDKEHRAEEKNRQDARSAKKTRRRLTTETQRHREDKRGWRLEVEG
jgi:FtsZ-binding cell division protein ZapB